jgi:hypothetical protein
MADLESSRFRTRGLALLLLLLTGILSAGIDLVEDHPDRNQVSDHSESDSRASHLVRHHADKAAPCNACFFKSLLGQVLLTAQHAPAAPDCSTPRIAERFLSLAHAEYNAEGNRGPPRSS